MVPELRLLGGATLIAADGTLISGAAAQPRRVAVLAVLADAWPAAVTRDRIVGLIWPENDDAGARRLLTQALYSLRSELGDITRVSGRDVALNERALRVDLVELRQALEAGEVERAAALYRGPFLDGVHLRDAVEFERWSDTVRDEARRRFQAAVESLVAEHAAAGRHREAARWAERLVQTAPFDTTAVLGAIALHERAGDRGGAIAIANSYERRMREELELEPDPVVRRRIESLRIVAPPDEPIVAAPTDATPDVSDGSRERAVPQAVMPEPRPDTPPAGAPRSRRLRWLPAAGVAALAGGIAVAIALASRPRISPPSGPPPRIVRLEPVQVRSDMRTDASFGAALTAILVANLDGTAGTRVMRADRDSAPRGDWPTLRATVVATGGELRLGAELVGADGAPRSSEVSVRGSRDSLISLAERLSLELLPALHPEVAGTMNAELTHRFRRVSMLKLHYTGEDALRRGEYEAAHAAFVRVTEQRPDLAWSWFRRAVAAELAHRNDDADESVKRAEALEGSLPPRERSLLRGYARWRAGDAAAADSVFRLLAASGSQDVEAWLQLAEVAYHGGPLLGRPLDASRDPWRHVVALDSSNFTALIHAIRLEARARDTVGVTALLRRLALTGAVGPAAQESRVVAAYAVGRPREVRDLVASLPDYSLDFLHAVIAGQLEQPAAAAAIAGGMTEASRPDAVRAEGYIALASLSMAQGRWRDAWRELDRASRLNPLAAAWWRAYLATLPFARVPGDVRAAAARDLAAAPISSAAAPLYLQLAVDAPAAPMVRRYMLEQLRLAGVPGLAEAGQADCRTESSPSTIALCEDLRLGLAAEMARREGNDEAALRRLDSVRLVVPYQLAARSVFFARTRERFLRAELLFRQGRLAEAYRWYDAVPHGSRLDYLYLAPAHLRRGQIRERMGDRAEAGEHYRRALDLWRDPDPELAGLAQEAAAGLRRVGGRR